MATIAARYDIEAADDAEYEALKKHFTDEGVTALAPGDAESRVDDDDNRTVTVHVSYQWELSPPT